MHDGILNIIASDSVRYLYIIQIISRVFELDEIIFPVKFIDDRSLAGNCI